ncbi:MAG: type II secretion system protein [Verrucomicrobiota bacterium]
MNATRHRTKPLGSSTTQNVSEIEEGKLMNCCASIRQTRAFTLIELFVIVVILALLFATLVPAVALSKRKAQRIKCTNNLKQIGLAFRLFSTDHGEKFPGTASTNQRGAREYLWQSNSAARYFSTLSNELAAPRILLCPTEARKPATNYAALTDANVS